MTIEQFLELNEMEKLCAIMESGKLMAQKLEPDTRIFLYRLQSFYVSACYCISTDQLTEIIEWSLCIDKMITLASGLIFLISGSV